MIFISGYDSYNFKTNLEKKSVIHISRKKI